jgi:hypothetical protein
MAFTETPKEKEKRLAYYARNEAIAKDKEAKADAETKRKFNETTNTDTSKNTNPMGDTYKKGGKIMGKKTKRYEDGGEVEFETKQGRNEGASIDDDVRSRAMAAVEKGISDEAPAKKSAPSFKAKASKAGFTSAETKGGAALMTRKDRSSTPKAAPKKSSSYTADHTMGAAMKMGGSVGSASRRADGCAVKGKTKGRMV